MGQERHLHLAEGFGHRFMALGRADGVKARDISGGQEEVRIVFGRGVTVLAAEHELQRARPELNEGAVEGDGSAVHLRVHQIRRRDPDRVDARRAHRQTEDVAHRSCTIHRQERRLQMALGDRTGLMVGLVGAGEHVVDIVGEVRQEAIAQTAEVTPEPSDEAPRLAVGSVDAVTGLDEASSRGERRDAVIGRRADRCVQAGADLGGLGGVELPEEGLHRHG